MPKKSGKEFLSGKGLQIRREAVEKQIVEEVIQKAIKKKEEEAAAAAAAAAQKKS